MRTYDQNVGRTARYSNTYFQNAPFEWNLLAEDIRNSTSIAVFKRKLLAMIRPNKNSIYGINDIVGVRYLSKLRLNFSVLNEHRFRHNFDCLDPVCLCGRAEEDSEHFLLHCHFFEEARRDLLGSSSDIPGLYSRTGHIVFMPFNSPDLTEIANRMIMEATISYIRQRRDSSEAHFKSNKAALPLPIFSFVVLAVVVSVSHLMLGD